MNHRVSMMLRVLINRYNAKESHALLKFLPKEEQEQIMGHQIVSSDLAPILQQPKKGLSTIHYSWIEPLLNHFHEKLRPNVAASFGFDYKQTSLQKPTTLSPLAKSFLLTEVYRLLDIDKHIPIEYLPKTELTALAHWTKTEIVNLIDYLGLYDLASEVRHIMNPNAIKKIYTSLTPKQFHFLKTCLHKKDQLTFPKLGVDLSKVEIDQLKQILHKRGLIRLSRAFYGQDPDLIWHVSHVLDMTRGQIFLKEVKVVKEEKVTQILQQQVLLLMNFLKTSNL
jgi:hypothetical protein